MYASIELCRFELSIDLIMLTRTTNANPRLTKILPNETKEQIKSLIAGSLPDHKSIFRECFLANQHSAMPLYLFMVTKQINKT
jgi:hypothetical protein